jgi:hypothetical protein
MSRSFVAASSHYLQVEQAAVTAAPFTMFCWYNIDGTATFNTLMAIQRSATTAEWWRLRARNGQPLLMLLQNNAAEFSVATSTSCSINVWQSACAVEYSSSNRAIFLNGAGKGTNTTTRAPASVNRTTVGMVRGTFAGEGTNGLIAHPAIWNAALDDAEVAMLAAGISPLRVRPQSLVMYLPHLGRDSPEIDIINARTLAVTGATASSNEPPVRFPLGIN